MGDESDIEAQKKLITEVRSLRSQFELLERSKLKNEEGLTSCIRIWCYLIIVGLFVTVGLVIIVLALNVVPMKEKEFLVSVVLLVFGAILALLIVARNHPQALIGLISAGLAVSCFVLGLVSFGFGKMFQ